MKKFIIIVLIALITPMYCFSQNNNYKKEGKTIIQTSTARQSSSKDVQTEYTYKDTKGNTYPIFLHQYTKGEKAGKWGCYVIKTSAKTGKEYKYYIPNGEEIAKDIMKE